MNNPPPGYFENIANFEEIVTLNGNTMSYPINYPVDWETHIAYRGVPDSSNIND